MVKFGLVDAICPAILVGCGAFKSKETRLCERYRNTFTLNSYYIYPCSCFHFMVNEMSRKTARDVWPRWTSDAGSGNRTQATLVGGERSYHCATFAPLPLWRANHLPLHLHRKVERKLIEREREPPRATRFVCQTKVSILVNSQQLSFTFHVSGFEAFTADLINADLFKVQMTAVEDLHSSVPIIQCAKRGPGAVISLKPVVAVLAALGTRHQYRNRK